MTLIRKDFGKKAEKLAATYLKKKKFKIIQTNWVCRLGEIDIIAKKDETLVFVEVKAGHKQEGFSPEDHFDHRKQQKLRLLAKAYLSNLKDLPECRFDLITVRSHQDSVILDHFEDVIEDTYR